MAPAPLTARPPRSPRPPRWVVVAGLLAAAALLRVSIMLYHDIPGDDATVALVAKHFLSGEAFPVFFYRQAYMGSLNGVHLVPALFLFGPSVMLVPLNAIAYSLLFPLLLYVLGRRLFDEATARAALLLAAVPPFLLTKWSATAEPHFETNIFGLVLLLLALAALEAEPGSPRSVRVLACFGLTAGLAWWTNFKVLEIILPALLVLWARDPRLPRRRAAAFAAGGFLLGSLPVWIFYATRAQGDAAERASQLFQPGLPLSVERLGALLTTVAPTLLGTYYWPAHAPARLAALLAYIGVYAVACALIVVETARLRRRGGTPGAREWGLWLLLLALVAPFGMLLASTFVRTFDHETSRYVLPTYVPLLLAAGALVGRLRRRSRVAGTALLAFLLAFNLWTHARHLWPLDAAERDRRARHIAGRETIVRHLAAHPVQALYVDQPFLSLVLAFHLWRLPVSEPTGEFYLPHAVAADAADRVAILARDDHPRVAEALTRLGATYRTTRFPGARFLVDDIRAAPRLFEDIQVAPRAYRLVPRQAWRVRGDPATPPAVADGDLATAWPAEVPAGRVAAETVVDLGAAYAVGRLVWWPSTAWEETPPLALAVSADGVRWEPLGEVPTRRPAFVAGGRPFFRPRNGWLEVRLPPRRVRYLRFARTEAEPGAAWGMAELYVYEDGGPLPDSDTGPDGRALAAILGPRGVTRLLADPALSARVARATGGAIGTLTANAFLDSHGRYLPLARLAEPVRLRETDGLLVPHEDAEDLRARLLSERIEFHEDPVAQYRLFYGLAPVRSPLGCRRTTWAVTGVVPDETGARYTLEAELPAARRLAGLRLEHPPVRARQVPLPVVAVSGDGRTWRRLDGARRLDGWGWAGRTLFRFSGSAEELLLPPTPARHVRIELWLPYRGERPITSVCARLMPLAGSPLALRRRPEPG